MIKFSFSISAKFVLQSAFYTKLLVSVVRIALTSLINSSYKVFLTTPFFTTSFCLLKSTGVVSILPLSNLSISDFNLDKSTFLASFYVSTPAAFFKSSFVS